VLEEAAAASARSAWNQVGGSDGGPDASAPEPADPPDRWALARPTRSASPFQITHTWEPGTAAILAAFAAEAVVTARVAGMTARAAPRTTLTPATPGAAPAAIAGPEPRKGPAIAVSATPTTAAAFIVNFTYLSALIPS